MMLPLQLLGRDWLGQTDTHEEARKRLGKMFAIGRQQAQMLPAGHESPKVGQWERINSAEVYDAKFGFESSGSAGR